MNASKGSISSSTLVSKGFTAAGAAKATEVLVETVLDGGAAGVASDVKRAENLEIFAEFVFDAEPLSECSAPSLNFVTTIF